MCKQQKSHLLLEPLDVIKRRFHPTFGDSLRHLYAWLAVRRPDAALLFEVGEASFYPDLIGAGREVIRIVCY